MFLSLVPAQYAEAPLTCVDHLSSHGQQDLTVPGSVGHQLQHLLVGLALDRHGVDAHEFVPGPKAPVLLRGAQGHDGADVHLSERTARLEQLPGLEGLLHWCTGRTCTSTES